MMIIMFMFPIASKSDIDDQNLLLATVCQKSNAKREVILQKMENIVKRL
jgi:hypothetical protein